MDLEESRSRLFANGSEFEVVDLKKEAVVGLEKCMPEKAIWFGIVIAIASVEPDIAVVMAADYAVVVDIVAEMAEVVPMAVYMKSPTAPALVSKGYGCFVAGHSTDHRVVSAALGKLQSRNQTGR